MGEELTEQERAILDWRIQYEELSKNPPQEGDFLYADDACGKEKLTRLIIECQPGKQPFIYAKVFIPDIVGEKLGWYTQPMGSESHHGLTCILMPKARNEVITKFGITRDEVGVKGLRVLKASETKRSLLVEVSDWP
jgi:hypothetical protein